jgi:DNA-binding transcriptional regulator YiaG
MPIKTPKRAQMTGDEMQRCLDAVGMNQRDYAVLVEVDETAVRKRRADTRDISAEGAILLRLLAAHPELLDEAWGAAGLPGGREVRPRGRPRKGDDTDG